MSIGRAHATKLYRMMFFRVALICCCSGVRVKMTGSNDTLLTNIGSNHQVVTYGYGVSGSQVSIYTYDNKYPDQEVILSTDMSDMGSSVMHTDGSRLRRLFVENYSVLIQQHLYLLKATGAGAEMQWALWGGGENAMGSCPAGTDHVQARKTDYILTHNSPGNSSQHAHNSSSAIGQDDWRWCLKCSGLFWAGRQAASGVCPTGGKHDRGQSRNYTLRSVPVTWRTIVPSERSYHVQIGCTRHSTKRPPDLKRTSAVSGRGAPAKESDDRWTLQLRGGPNV